MPDEMPGNSPPADEVGNPIERPQSPEVAVYWLAAVVDSADDAIITKTLEGVITSWNPGARKLFGYTAEEVIGRPVTMLIPDDHLDEEPAILARIRAGERVEHYETVRRRKDGTLIDISLTVSPIRKPDGTIIGASKIARDITGQRGAQETLRAQAAVIAQAYDAIFLRDSSNAITLWNRGAERTYGYTPEEALGRSPHELLKTVPPVPLEEIYASLRREGYWEGELLHTRKDGEQIVVETRWATVRDDRGQITSILEITRDVTGRRRAEVRLRHAAAIVENSDDAIISKDLDGIIRSWNPGAERLYGYTPEEAVGRPVTMLIPEDRPDEEPGILARIRAGRRVDHYETVRVTKDGRLLDVSLTVSPVRDTTGRVVGASKIARDITERKRAEAELSQSRAQLATVFENATVSLFVMDARQHCTYMNPAAEKLTGYTLAEVQGRPLHYFVHHTRPDGTPYPLEECPIDRAFPENNQEQGEDVFVHKDGRFYTVAFTASPLRENGRPVGTVIEVRDTTDEKRAADERERLLRRAQEAREEAEASASEKERMYREAQEANRLKDEFLATVSHELRTPLTAMLGWAHMLRTGQFDGSSNARALETIERNARSQAQLIDDLLDVSRAITGKLRIDVRPVDPNSFIEAAVEAVRPAAGAKGVRLQRVLDSGVVSVSGDPVRLQQVVWNLLSNAIKFTPRGGRVQVRMERVNSHVEIAVSDTGIGISPEFLPHVFDRFRQADQKTTRRHGGLGLGLAIVRHLVELHGGTVRAESEGEGHGSTFTVLLPVAPINPPGPQEARVHPAARDTLPAFDCPDRLDRLRVLVVDDEPDTREMLKAGLALCGAVVTTAGSAAEAVAEIQVAPPDVLISDIGMPEEDGYDLIRKVRALPAEGGGRVPAIALTAYARAEDRMQALRSGYQMHVPKPVELAELAAVVASLAKRDG